RLPRLRSSGASRGCAAGTGQPHAEARQLLAPTKGCHRVGPVYTKAGTLEGVDELTSVSVREARANLARLLDQAEAGEPTGITRGGEPVAAIVPIDEYEALEEAADELLARKALRTLEEEGDAPRATLADVLADIFGPPTSESSTGAA